MRNNTMLPTQIYGLCEMYMSNAKYIVADTDIYHTLKHYMGHYGHSPLAVKQGLKTAAESINRVSFMRQTR